MPTTGDLLSTTAAATRIGVSRRTLLNYIADGKIPAFRYSPRIIRIRAEDVDAFIRNAETAGAVK